MLQQQVLQKHFRNGSAVSANRCMASFSSLIEKKNESLPSRPQLLFTARKDWALYLFTVLIQPLNSGLVRERQKT